MERESVSLSRSYQKCIHVQRTQLLRKLREHQRRLLQAFLHPRYFILVEYMLFLGYNFSIDIAVRRPAPSLAVAGDCIFLCICR